jgi:hypothetical protein
MDFSKKVILSDDLFVQEIDDEVVMLDMKSENYYGLDPVGADIWKFLSEGKTIGETKDSLMEIYDVDTERLESDLVAFITELVENGLAKIA